jgi:mRNA-degrading endonuclease YafQ of YafQ-DinJ toxin-antitoxin module
VTCFTVSIDISKLICHIRHMWSVEFENSAVEKEVAALIKSKKLTTEDQAIIHAWIQQISANGPESIRGDFKWADHALHGDWTGYRSSAFSNRGRIIYRIVNKKVVIKIARITDKHDYKKGQKK